MELQDNDEIYYLEISVRAYNVLHRKGINTIGDLKGYCLEDIRKVRNCGQKTLDEIENALNKFNINMKLNKKHQYYTKHKNYTSGIDYLDVQIYADKSLRGLCLNDYEINLHALANFNFVRAKGKYTEFEQRNIIISTLYFLQGELSLLQLANYFMVSRERIRQITKKFRILVTRLFWEYMFYEEHPEYIEFDTLGYHNLFRKIRHEDRIIVADNNYKIYKVKTMDFERPINLYIDDRICDLFGYDTFNKLSEYISNRTNKHIIDNNSDDELLCEPDDLYEEYLED